MSHNSQSTDPHNISLLFFVTSDIRKLMTTFAEIPQRSCRQQRTQLCLLVLLRKTVLLRTCDKKKFLSQIIFMTFPWCSIGSASSSLRPLLSSCQPLRADEHRVPSGPSGESSVAVLSGLRAHCPPLCVFRKRMVALIRSGTGERC
jgi:hypothetical protein